MPREPRPDTCGRKWKGHVCVLPAMSTDHGATEGDHTHLCLCKEKWVSKHRYRRHPASGAGNCWCGRDSRAGVHDDQVSR